MDGCSKRAEWGKGLGAQSLLGCVCVRECLLGTWWSVTARGTLAAIGSTPGSTRMRLSILRHHLRLHPLFSLILWWYRCASHFFLRKLVLPGSFLALHPFSRHWTPQTFCWRSIHFWLRNISHSLSASLPVQVLRQLQQGLAKCYSVAFEKCGAVSDAKITPHTLNFVKKLVSTFGVGLENVSNVSTMFSSAASESLARRAQATAQDPVFQKMKGQFTTGEDRSRPVLQLHFLN